MLFNVSVLEKFLTSDFLVFSWNDLKKRTRTIADFSEKKAFKPISKVWFEKSSLLVRKGKFNYQKFSKIRTYNLKQEISISFCKAKILEHAFLLIIRPYFINSSYFKSFDLTQCLRI